MEEFKFRKEMDKARDKMIADMERNKAKAKMDAEALERVKKRQDDLISRKTEAIWRQKNV